MEWSFNMVFPWTKWVNAVSFSWHEGTQDKKKCCELGKMACLGILASFHICWSDRGSQLWQSTSVLMVGVWESMIPKVGLKQLPQKQELPVATLFQQIGIRNKSKLQYGTQVMENKQTGRARWSYRDQGAVAKVQIALVSHILGCTCLSLSFWKERGGGS